MPSRADFICGLLPLLLTTAKACSSDLDCSLNGRCVSSNCECSDIWTGLACDILKTSQPARIESYGGQKNFASWGGNVIAFGGKFHLYVAEMVGQCGLQTWTTNSQIVHATSDTIDGPFEKEDVAVAPWAHNPQIVHVPSHLRAGGGDLFVLFHIGDGTGSETRDCSKSLRHCAVSPSPSPPPRDGQAPFHTAPSPEGPWTLQHLPFDCNNPAPMLRTDGSWMLICNGGGWVLWSAPELAGPWTIAAKLSRPAASLGAGVHYEDPFLWEDDGGHLHALGHAYNNTTPCDKCDDLLLSVHMFSGDQGRVWEVSPNQPFLHEVRDRDGKEVSFSTRERPKLIFTDGRPTHLVTGVSPLVNCAPTPRVDCKTAPGGWWTFTLIQPLGAAAPSTESDITTTEAVI